MPRPIVSRIANVNHERDREPEMRTQLSQDVRERMKHHDTSQHVTDMSHETYYHAGRPNY